MIPTQTFGDSDVDSRKHDVQEGDRFHAEPRSQHWS